MSLEPFARWRTFVAGYLMIVRTGIAVPISLDSEPPHHHRYQPEEVQDHHVSVASSYMHFHGPVEGPEFEVKVPYVAHHRTSDEHNDSIRHDGGVDSHHGASEDHDSFLHDYTLDYVAHPKYKFSYGVEDHHTGDFHGQKETRDGSSVSGEYSVMEPGGVYRVVTYHAGKDGFHAVVHTSGKNDHSGATYSSSVHHPQGHHHHLQIEEEPQHREHQEIHDQIQHQGSAVAGHGLQEYASEYGVHDGYQ